MACVDFTTIFLFLVNAAQKALTWPAADDVVMLLLLLLLLHVCETHTHV